MGPLSAGVMLRAYRFSDKSLYARSGFFSPHVILVIIAACAPYIILPTATAAATAAIYIYI